MMSTALTHHTYLGTCGSWSIVYTIFSWKASPSQLYNAFDGNHLDLNSPTVWRCCFLETQRMISVLHSQQYWCTEFSWFHLLSLKYPLLSAKCLVLSHIVAPIRFVLIHLTPACSAGLLQKGSQAAAGNSKLVTGIPRKLFTDNLRKLSAFHSQADVGQWALEYLVLAAERHNILWQGCKWIFL